MKYSCDNRTFEIFIHLFWAEGTSHLARLINSSRTVHVPCTLIAQRGRNSNCEYFYICISLWCLQLMSSCCDIRVHFSVARQCYFKCECKCCGTLSCFIQKCVSLWLFTVKTLKSVPLNSCCTKANQQWIGSFPANQCDRLVKSKTAFSSVHPSAIEPESELRLK